MNNKNDEYFVSDKKVEFQQFLDHYLELSTDDESDSSSCTSHVETVQLPESCSYTTQCDRVLVNGDFESCSAIIPPQQYVETCTKTSCSGWISVDKCCINSITLVITQIQHNEWSAERSLILYFTV